MLPIPQRLKYFSDWYRARKAIAVCLRLRQRLRCRAAGVQGQEYTNTQPSKVEDLCQAEVEIIKAVQSEAFSKEIELLKPLKSNRANRQVVISRKACLKKTSSLCHLDPFIDNEGLLRVGGRINRADTPYHIKHPVILPRKGHGTALIIRYYHQRINHQGRRMTLNEIRENGFWIIGGSPAVARHIIDCVSCQRLRGNVGEQKMANLPRYRLEPAPPLTFCGVDYFSPWYIKGGRKELKRYGVLFTCLSSRVIHLETAKSLEPDSFINALHRFLARRGPVRLLRSDQRTNLVGAKRQ